MNFSLLIKSPVLNTKKYTPSGISLFCSSFKSHNISYFPDGLYPEKIFFIFLPSALKIKMSK
jgi:hypothetical protein